MGETQQEGEAPILHVNRGGSWASSNRRWSSASYRGEDPPSTSGINVGFRCVRRALRAPAAENVAGVLTAQRRAL